MAVTLMRATPLVDSNILEKKVNSRDGLIIQVRHGTGLVSRVNQKELKVGLFRPGLGVALIATSRNVHAPYAPIAANTKRPPFGATEDFVWIWRKSLAPRSELGHSATIGPSGFLLDCA